MDVSSIALIVLCISSQALGSAESYNQPKLCPSASWNPNATTIANNETIGLSQFSIFVTKNNTLYGTSWEFNQILVWLEENPIPIEINSSISIDPFNLFVSVTDDIYIYHSYSANENSSYSENIHTNGSLTSTNGTVHLNGRNYSYCEGPYNHYFHWPDICEYYFCYETKGTSQRFSGGCRRHKNRWENKRSRRSVNDQAVPHVKTTIGNNDKQNPNSAIDGRVYKLSSSDDNDTVVMNVNGSCVSLFIINNTIYCSLKDRHQVVKKSLYPDSESLTIVAGNGSIGSTSNMLNEPQGIFVDIDFSLYVADYQNNRIQRFGLNQSDGKTVAGFESNSAAKLSRPTDVILDADGCLFIVHSGRHRIVRSQPDGLQCIAGCEESSDSTSKQSFSPWSLRFDSHGNLFVSDWNNNLIQKFLLQPDSCSKALSSDFFVPTCNGRTPIDIGRDELDSPCKMATPCQNDGSCIDDNTISTEYSCKCSSDFEGDKCQDDRRFCKSDTCRNDGTCIPSDTTFECRCQNGWTGIRCEIRINNCTNATCLNNGVCRPSLMNYTCECLGESYSGRHCEVVATKIKIYKMVSKSFAYVGIIAMISVVIFIVVMNILKYCFGIAPVREERERIRRKKYAKKRKPVTQRFVYVNGPQTTLYESSRATLIEATI